MLNLLPKDSKDKVRGEYLRRFSVILLIGLSFIDVFLLVAIFPSYILLNSKKEIAEEASVALANSSNAKDRNIVLSNIKDLDERLKIVEMVPGEKPTDYIGKALELQTKGVSILNISYTKKDQEKKEITLEGIAHSRAGLIEFSKKVKSSDWASYSDIPISNLANDKNIRFFVTLIATSTINES